MISSVPQITWWERLINEDQVLEINFDDFEYYKNLDSSIIEASQILTGK